jgi:decaprenyl-phosphate phosphoribosyltransferase
MMLKDIISVFRPKRWFQNLITIIGGILPIQLMQLSYSVHWRSILLCFIASCVVSSANYGINEVLDAEQDKHHPQKKNRAIASGRLTKPFVIFGSVILYIIGLIIVYDYINIATTIVLCLFILTAVLYNVKPFRFKDVPYLDFTFEALNSPLRILLGWYSVTEHIFPASLILAVWFLGVFLMAAKRFGDLRLIEDKNALNNYRRSQKYYTEKKLLFAMIGSLSIFYYMLGALCMKYSIDLIITLPFIIVWTIWFFHLAHEENTIVKDPERIFENIPFVSFSALTFGVFVYLFMTKSHVLNFLKK